MSEKRFKVDYDNCSGGRIMDRKDKYGQYCRLYDFGEVGRQQIVDLLNSLSDENEQLRQDKEVMVEFIKKEFPKSYKHILEGFE